MREDDNIPKAKDLTGARFGRWTVMHKSTPLVTPSGNTFTRWHCICDCGNEKDVTTNSLTSGRSVSCGCKHSEIQTNVAKQNFKTHGDSKTRLYRIWAGMRKRCNNPNATNYEDYGGRGIKVCDEWDSFVNFRDWALSNGYNNDLSIDRIDNSLGYCPENCRWADNETQNNNRRSNTYFDVNGERMTLADIARAYNIPYKSLWKKIHNGKNISDIIN